MTLAERGLDFERAMEVFDGRHVTAEDEDAREDDSELRFITVGELDAKLLVVVWTKRGDVRRIISMRKANDREKARHAQRMGGP